MLLVWRRDRSQTTPLPNDYYDEVTKICEISLHFLSVRQWFYITPSLLRVLSISPRPFFVRPFFVAPCRRDRESTRPFFEPPAGRNRRFAPTKLIYQLMAIAHSATNDGFDEFEPSGDW